MDPCWWIPRTPSGSQVVPQVPLCLYNILYQQLSLSELTMYLMKILQNITFDNKNPGKQESYAKRSNLATASGSYLDNLHNHRAGSMC